MWIKANSPTLLVGTEVGSATAENSLEGPLKYKSRTTRWPSILLLGICPQKTIIQKDTCTAILTVALYTIVKIWKHSVNKCLPIEEWIKNMWCACTHTYTMEYYSAIKKNEIMPFAATWMQLEIIILNQTEKDKYILLISNLSNIKYDTDELI